MGVDRERERNGENRRNPGSQNSDRPLVSPQTSDPVDGSGSMKTAPSVQIGQVDVKEIEGKSREDGEDEPKRKRSTHSIVSGKSGREDRVDANGVPIQRGSKQHTASFADEQGQGPVVEHKEVTAYKNSGPYRRPE